MSQQARLDTHRRLPLLNRASSAISDSQSRSSTPSSELSPAAQYLRMSTDHQQYSIVHTVCTSFTPKGYAERTKVNFRLTVIPLRTIMRASSDRGASPLVARCVRPRLALRTVVRPAAPMTWRKVPVHTRTTQSVVYSNGGRSRYAAESRERHLGSVITACRNPNPFRG